jgi:hypothetical protein
MSPDRRRRQRFLTVPSEPGSTAQVSCAAPRTGNGPTPESVKRVGYATPSTPEDQVNVAWIDHVDGRE